MDEIIQTSFENTLSELDPLLAYQESCYQNCMLYFLRRRLSEHQISQEVVIPYKISSGVIVGHGRADIILQTEKEIFILELKRGFCNLSNARTQLKRYMRHFSTNKLVRGFLIVFNLSPRSEEIFT